jgi:hypothetical protein
MTRLVIVFLFFAPILLLNFAIVIGVIDKLAEPWATYVDIVRHLTTLPLLLVSYGMYCRIIEKRGAVELGRDGAIAQWLAGAAVSGLIVSSFVLLIDLVGDFRILEYRGGLQLVSNLATFTNGSLLQELVLLCVVFRLVEEVFGTWASLVGSLAIFAGLHLANEAQTLTSVAMLMFSSLILVAPFILSRKIYLSWGFHAGWNFAQAGVFGMLNSGIAFKGWMISEVIGPEWLTGGAVGIEGSPLAVAIDFLVGLGILLYARKRGMFVGPKWRRNTLPVTQPA